MGQKRPRPGVDASYQQASEKRQVRQEVWLSVEFVFGMPDPNFLGGSGLGRDTLAFEQPCPIQRVSMLQGV